MAFIIETKNPFEPLKGLIKHEVEPGKTLRHWLEDTYPGFKEFDKPTICLVNGEPLLRQDWDTYHIQHNDIINFIAVAGVIIAIAIAIILVVVTVVLTLTMAQAPPTPGQLPASDPVFSAKGQQNEIRLGEPIEVNYGRNRIYPSYAARPYYQYENNDQYQHSLFCIGQGYYEIEAAQIGDTSIDSYQEVEYEIVDPGGTVTLFPTNIYTSSEAGGQTLYAPNESEYVSPGYVGPFVACPVGETVSHIDVDLFYPKGLYKVKNNGGLKFISITVVWEAQLIDDSNNPLDSWFTLTSTSASGATTTPQRVTLGSDVTPGRYWVRARRTSDKDTSTRAGNDAVWDGMKAQVVGSEPDYGNVTLMAVKLKATNNLNQNTLQKFNVVATRKLATRESTGTWSDPVVTRSIVWAFVDVFMSTYGGRVTDDSFLDWDTLQALELVYESRGEYFDWTFRDPMTVWDAATAIAAVGRAVPMISGSLISMRRDSEQTLPVTLFSPDNMVKGSFEWTIKLWGPDEYDSVMIEYTEPSTGYLQEQVLCALPESSSSDHPQQIRLSGCQDRDAAYHQGLYLAAVARYIRENISFITGMEGFIPTYGDLVAVAFDVPKWGQSGFIVSAVENSDGTYTLTCSEPLDFAESGQVYYMFLRDKNGSSLGPYQVLPTSVANIVTLDGGSAVISDFLTDGTTEPMLFLFGLLGTDIKYGRVVAIEPQGGERIKITLVNNDTTIYSYDDLSAPALPSAPTLPDTPDVPEITEALTLTQVESDKIEVLASWQAAFGAVDYILQTYDPTWNWWTRLTVTTETTYQWVAYPGTLYVRVAPRNKGRGAWVTASIILTQVASLRLDIDFTALEWEAIWSGLGVIDSYQITLYDNSGSAPVEIKTFQQTTKTYDYTYADALSDGVVTRDYLLEVDSMYIDDTTNALTAAGSPAQLEITNDIPAAPTSATATFDSVDSYGDYVYHFTWTNPTDDDLIAVKIWVSETDGFDPSVVEPMVHDVASAIGYTNVISSAYITLPTDSNGVFPTHYWRIAVFDVWGNEISTNITSQGTITLDWILATGSWDDLGNWQDTSNWQDS